MDTGIKAILLVSSILLARCNGGSDPADGSGGATPAHPFGVDAEPVYLQEHVHGQPTTSTDWRSSTICEMAWYMDGGAGYYLVESVTGVGERPLGAGADTTPQPWTYAQLRRIEDWSGTAPEHVTFRHGGGPTGPDSWRSVAVGFDEGEEVGVFIKGADQELNEGFPVTVPDAVWRVRGDGLAQDGLGDVVDPSDLAARIRAAYDALPDVDQPFVHECPVQIPWGLCPPETLWPDDAPRFFDAPDSCSGETDGADVARGDDVEETGSAHPDAGLGPEAGN